MKRLWSKQTEQSPDGGHKQRKFPIFVLEKLGPILLWIILTTWNPKMTTKPSKLTIGTSGTRPCLRSRLAQTTRLGTYWHQPHIEMSLRANKSTEWNWNPVVMWTNPKLTMWQRGSNNWKDWTILRLFRLHVSFSDSGVYFSYQRSGVIWCTRLMSRGFSCTHQKKNKCIWNRHVDL